MMPADRRQLRITTPEMRAADLKRVRGLLRFRDAKHVTRRQVELFYDLALGDVQLAAQAMTDVAAGRVNHDLRELRKQEDH